MTLIISVGTPEGIVMAADSRYIHLDSNTGELKGYTDFGQKLFLTDNHVGISIYGATPTTTANLLDDFIKNMLSAKDDVYMVAKKLLKFRKNLGSITDLGFHVCGYDKKGPKLLRLGVNKEEMEEYGTQAILSGQCDVFNAIENNSIEDFPTNNYTIQDAIDFSWCFIKFTSEVHRLQFRKNISIGGPIDILTIKQSSSKWISKKKVCSPEETFEKERAQNKILK